MEPPEHIRREFFGKPLYLGLIDGWHGWVDQPLAVSGFNLLMVLDANKFNTKWIDDRISRLRPDFDATSETFLNMIKLL